TPALTPAGGKKLPVADTEPDRAAVGVEEAGVDGDDRRVRCRDLLDGSTHGGSAGRNQAKLRHLEIDLECVDLERLGVVRAPLEARVLDARRHRRETWRLRDGARRRAAQAEERCRYELRWRPHHIAFREPSYHGSEREADKRFALDDVLEKKGLAAL